MIIDGHAHIFENWTGSNGHESQDVHLKYLQKSMLRPSARVMRARDGVPADMARLFPLGDNTWKSLRDDVDFRSSELLRRLRFVPESYRPPKSPAYGVALFGFRR